MNGIINNDAATGELRPVALSAVKALQQRIFAAIPKATDPATALHLRDCKRQIENVLNPKVAPAAGIPGLAFGLKGFDASLPEAQSPGYECRLTAAQDWLKALQEEAAR